jgi:Ser/Thr protein kinase RdoA (MazF antagonist)
LGYHSDAALRSELQWMAYLRSNGLETPRPIASHNGDLFVQISALGAEPRQVDCLSWLEGNTLGQTAVPLDHSAERLGKIFHALGRTIARMHNATECWQLPAGFQRHRWDFDGFFGKKPIWGEFHTSTLIDAKQRELVSHGRQKAMHALSAYEQSGRNFGLIHADLVRENLLVRDNEIQVIDFDDCGFGWYMYDAATPISFYEHEPQAAGLIQSWTTGYRRVLDLPKADEDEIPTFVMLRRLLLVAWIGSHAETDLARSMGLPYTEATVGLCEAYLSKFS